MVATMLHGCVTLVRRPRYPGWFSKDVEGAGDAKSSLARIHAPKLNRRGVRAIHDRVCRLFHRPGRMQDVTCLTISSHSTNPPLPSPLLSSLRILADSSSRLLATGLPSYAALRPAPICANLPLRPLSLSLCCFLVPIRHWLLSLSAFPGQQLETKRSNPQDFARGCFFERISRRIWVRKLLEVCGVRVVEGGMEDVGTSFDYKIVYITFYSVVVEYISKYYEM